MNRFRMDPRLLIGALLLVFAIPPPLAGTSLAPGVTYEHRVVDGPVSVHILVVDPKLAEVFPVRALNDGVGRETVSSMARRKGALAAVNGGYFANGERYDGDPTGNLKIDASWYSTSSSPSAAIAWKKDGSRTLIGKIGVDWRVRLGETTFRFTGLNRARGRREKILYSWDFHRSTLTDPGGLELAIRDGRVISITRDGDCAIPPGGFVASFGPAAAQEALDLKVGARAVPAPTVGSISPSPPASEWEEMDYIVGGGPILLGPGTEAGFGESGFAEKRHPRTAVGVRPDGTWVLLVVDGRQPTVSLGMSLAELAGMLESLGCEAGLNLDGGGSTALFLSGKIANSPSDFGTERMISDAILVRAKQP